MFEPHTMLAASLRPTAGHGVAAFGRHAATFLVHPSFARAEPDMGLLAANPAAG